MKTETPRKQGGFGLFYVHSRPTGSIESYALKGYIFGVFSNKRKRILSTVRKIKPAEKAYKVTDEKGLQLLVNPSGGKLRRMRCGLNGKEKLLSFGTYPEVSLIRAREKRDEARRLLADDIFPPESTGATGRKP